MKNKKKQLLRRKIWELPSWLSRNKIWLVSKMTQVRSLASLSRLRIVSCGIGHRWAWIWRCLSCGVSQWPQLRFLGISICHECGPQKKKKKEKVWSFLVEQGVNNAVVWVTAVARVQSLAQEFPNVAGAAKNKQTKNHRHCFSFISLSKHQFYKYLFIRWGTLTIILLL